MFYSIDRKGFSEKNIHSFNRYAYANNNSYRFVDLDGNNPLGIIALEVARWTGAGYVMGIGADAISQYAAFGSIDWGMAATSTSAQVGATVGLFTGLTGPTSAPIGSAAEGALQVTAHGAERIAGAEATRGGVLSVEGITAVREGGLVMTQAD